MEKGYLAIILHAHLPFVRHPEYADSLEENWLYEAITETYIPLLLALEDLLNSGIDFRLTFSLTPTLTSMFQDPFLQSRYLRRIESLIELTRREIKRTESQPEFHDLARFYHQRLRQVRAAFVRHYKKNLIEAFRGLQESGKVEIIASAATHGYLPLLSANASAVRAQILVGIDHYEKLFGRKPRGFWLPECGYYWGVDGFLRDQGIQYTIVETHGVTRADPRPRHGVYAPICCPTGIAVFGRDPEATKQVWSSIEGYPGDYDYREFYRDIGYDLDLEYIRPYIHPDGIRIDTGIKYYRITGQGDHKEVYVPEWAEKKAEIHAGNFMFNREKQAEYLARGMDRRPVIVAPYDAELFGHWWYEGPLWLHHLIRKIAREQETIRLITLSEYLEEFPVNQVSVPCPSSWGHEGFSDVWLCGRNDWIYPHLHWAATKMERLSREPPRGHELMERALKQATRELMLAQGSDWAFMMHGGAMTEYATKRIKTHLLRFYRLCQAIDEGMIDKEWLARVEDVDNIFPHIKYQSFC
ncbi:MAG: 1,4-alpha-glucan branching protein domain-containing protein [Thermodesulfobacteriota bacterium]|jgi:1,4-alpha-glucan branching enzyme